MGSKPLRAGFTLPISIEPPCAWSPTRAGAAKPWAASAWTECVAEGSGCVWESAAGASPSAVQSSAGADSQTQEVATAKQGAEALLEHWACLLKRTVSDLW